MERKCERCSVMKKTRDNPAIADVNPDPVCDKWLCYACYLETHKSKCYLCGAPNCCFLHFGGRKRLPCCRDCR